MKKQLFRKWVWRGALSLLVVMSNVLISRAQVGRYGFSQGTRPYVPLTGGTVLGTALANAVPGYATLSGTVHPLAAGVIPFPFFYNGGTYTGGFVASGGYLTLGSVPPFQRFIQPAGLNGRYYDIDHPISTAFGNNFEGVLAALAGDTWGNPVAGSLGEIRYQTLGAAPNRVFVVQWARMRVYGSGAGLLNYQVRLYETSNNIEFAYGPCQTDQAITVQVGLRGSTPNDFTNRTGTWAASTAGTTNAATLPVSPAAVPANGLVYTFTPPAPLPCGQPFSLVATPAGTQAVLRWRALAPNPGPYTLVYGPAGFNPAGGGLGSQTVTGTSATVTGLMPSTDYEFYVTQNCGGAAGTSPASSPPGRFRTTVLNDEAVDAIALPTTATCQPLAATTAGATPSAGNGYDPLLPCGSTTPSSATNDVWYTVTTAATGPASTALQLTVAGQGIQAGARTVRVYRATAAAGPFALIYCSDQLVNGNAPLTLVVAPLSPSTTYYVRVANNSYLDTTAGPFTICSTVPAACGDPTNVNAFAGVTATSALLNFTPGAGATGFTVVLTPAGGVPQTLSSSLTVGPIPLTGLAPATDYSGTLQANCAGGGTSAAVPFLLYTPPLNDALANALPLPVTATCQPVAGTTNNAVATFMMPGFPTGFPAGCGTNRPNDVWYTFTTPAAGLASQAVRISVTGKAGQVRAFSRTGGTYAQVGCAAGSATTAAPPLDLTQLTPATTYYVAVGNFSTPVLPQLGAFTICVTEPATCGTTQGVGISSITATTANLTFIAGTPAPAGTSYTVTLTAQGGVPVVLANSGSTGLIALTNLVPGTYYTATLQANCGATAGLSQPTTVRFRTLGPPANDLCADAVLLSCTNSRVAALLAGATAAGNPTAACGGPQPLGPGLWYRVVGTGDEVTVDFCAGYNDDPDLQLFIYTGPCTALTCVGSNDNSLGCYRQLPAYTFATVAGQDYYLLVADTGRPVGLPPGPGSGAFDLALRCTAPAAACPPPAGLAVQVLSTTSATVTWTAPPGSFSYQVIWQPLSGGGTAAPAVYNVGNNSVINTGHTATSLLPNTPYQVSVTNLCAGPAVAPLPRSRPATVDFRTVLGTRNPALAALVELYPNPAHATATLAVPAALRQGGAATATLYNALGQAVRRLALPAGAAPVALDVQGLPTGRYLLRLDTALGSLGKALVVD